MALPASVGVLEHELRGVFGSRLQSLVAYGLRTHHGSQVPVRTLALLKVVDWRFQLPVYPGDTIKCKTRVVEKTVRGRGKRGEVVWYRGITNQDGKTVQEGELILLIEARQAPRLAGVPAETVSIPSPNGMVE